MADNELATSLKFLRGDEAKLPTDKSKGQVYFAYKNVGTAEKPSYTGAIYMDAPIDGAQTRVKMTANADIADKVINDSNGNNILSTYLKSLGFTNDGKQVILIKGSGNDQTRIALPIASATKAGIVTTDAQTFGGTKTFATINATSLNVTGSSGFNYSGIETATGNKARPVWFAYDGVNGKPVINTNFTYNPSTQTLVVTNLTGTASKATSDAGGNNIQSTYIKGISIDKSTMTITKGSGATSTLSVRDKIYGSGTPISTSTDLDAFLETNVFKFGHISAIEGLNGLEKNDGIILSASWSANNNYGHQIYLDNSSYLLRHRYKSNTNGWSSWAQILDSSNYTTYTVKKDGTGASGSWGISITGNAAKLSVNGGSATQPIYFNNGVPTATSYSLNATLKAGTANRLAYYSGQYEVSATGNLKYHTATNTKGANQTILRIWGSTYGDTASTMVGGAAGALSWNDGGPQIRFGTSEGESQDGALIYTDNDSSGVGASFHFVSNQTDWSVNSKRFVARTSVIIGQNVHTTSNQGYNLYVNGTAYINGVLTAVGDCNLIAHGNEFNFVPTLKAAGGVWFNYRQTGGQPTDSSFIINKYSFGNGANKELANITDGLFSGAATYVRDSNNKTNNISITYSKSGQSSTSWLASWNGYELGAISPANVTAGKATILAAARKITLSGLGEGSVTFDGSKDVVITDVGYGAKVYVTTNATTTPYSRIAYYENSGSYQDASMIFVIDSGYSGGGFGIVKVAFRNNNITTAGQSNCEIKWLVRQNFAVNQLVVKGNAPAGGNQYADLYFKAINTYQAYAIRVLSSGGRGSQGRNWTFEGGTPRANADIRTYTYTTEASDAGTANSSNKLVTARTITLSGAVTGSVSFDGSTNVTLATTVNHSHSQYYDSTQSRTKNTVLAAPNGADGKATFRSLVAADIPTLTKSKISDFPTSLKNPNSLTITLNGGTTEGTNKFTYDGSAAKSINITPANIGAATSGHTHNYAGSVSAGGSANSAVKLDTATAGSSTLPVYFTDGKPVACRTSLAVSVTGSSASCTGNAATATKLQTSRTIFGKSFDGSGNVAGQGLFYGTYTATASSRYLNGGLQIRENEQVGSAQTDIGYAPSIGFHWSGKIAASLLFHNNGIFYFRKQDGTSRATIDANVNGNATSASSAAKLTTARTINGTNFDGSANITTEKWGIARNIAIRDCKSANTGTSLSIDGSQTSTYYLLMPSSARFTGTLGVGNSSGATLNFYTATDTIGAQIVAYSNRIEFVFK
jgi:hypothetical protein